MKLRQHAIQRIYERTKMLPRHVDEVLSCAAVVELGSGRACRLLLFYSPPDNGAKIAVVSNDRSSLFSVWHSHFVLPRDVAPVTPELEEEAREILQKFLNAKFSDTDDSPRLAVAIDIRLNGKVLSVRDVGDIRTEDARTQDSVLNAVAHFLAPIALGLDVNMDEDPNHIRYGIHLINHRTLVPAKHFMIVRHHTVMQRVSETA